MSGRDGTRPAPADLEIRDARVLWHPYTQHGLRQPALPVASAQGARLRLADGREILDAISSWWVTLHGHARPEIAAAIADQAARLEQVIFAGFTHEPAVALAEILAGAARERGIPGARVFFSDNGSTAVEVALKMAHRFHALRGEARRGRFIALHGAYHGDTFGAMSVGDPAGFGAPFRPLLFETDRVDPDDASGLDRLLDAKPGEHAALIIEPMVQGVSGMRFHSADFLRRAERLCRQAGVLLIADEVFTGFHRTGPLFAFEHAGIRPDLLLLSKGLTGGFLPLAATVATGSIFEAFLSEDRARAFLHGHSYSGNPIACAAAIASWRLLQRPECQERIRAIAARTLLRIDGLAGHPRAAAARALGTIGAVDVRGGEGYFSRSAPRLGALAIERGVLLRPLGRVLYAVPPYCVTDADLDRIYDTMAVLLDAAEESA